MLLSWLLGMNAVYIFRYSVNFLCFLLVLSLSCYCDSRVEKGDSVCKRKQQAEVWAASCLGLAVGHEPSTLSSASPALSIRLGLGLEASPLGPLVSVHEARRRLCAGAVGSLCIASFQA